jgi:hypothetical protein
MKQEKQLKNCLNNLKRNKMKYKLINTKTKEETLCDKVTIDGFDYYVSDENIPREHYYISWDTNYATEPKERFVLYVKSSGLNGHNPRLVIAATNPNINIPKVVDEVEEFENEYFKNTSWGSVNPRGHYEALRAGYNKSQETHSFNEENMIEFEEFCTHTDYKNGFGRVDRKELLQLWKEQQPKTLYYVST